MDAGSHDGINGRAPLERGMEPIRKEEKMIRNLKVLGLALVAVSALAAVTASVASAQLLGKVTSDGPVTIKGTEATVGINKFTSSVLSASRIECPGSIGTGHKITTTPHELIPNGATEVTATPHYKNCTTSIAGSFMTVTMNGCDYRLFDATTVAGQTDYEGKVELGPVGCGPVLLELYNGAAEAIKLCTITIKSGQTMAGLTLKNTPEAGGKKNYIDISGTPTGTHAEQEGACGAKTDANASLDVNGTAEGFTAAGVETGLTISD